MGWASRNTANRDQRPHRNEHRTERRTPKEDLRLSERLVDLIAPFREDGLTGDDYKELIAAAASAWNLSLLPEPERQAALDQVFRNARVKNRQEPAELIVALMQRKSQLFPHDDRAIVHFEVSESDGEFHVVVASTAG